MTDYRTDSQPPANGCPPDWYYRIGDRERGPMTLEQLKDLVAASGETARTISVRQHAEGDWIPYEAVDAATAQRLQSERTSPLPPPAVHTAARPGDNGGPTNAPRPPRKPIGEELRRNWPVTVGLAVLAILNIGLWYWLDPFYRTERHDLAVLTEAARKARDAQIQGVDGAERARISSATIREIKPMVEALRKSARACEPIRQHLLWAAENQLPKLFSGSGKEHEQSDAIFQRHMYEAGRLMGIDLPQPKTSVVFK
jgi:GYF domain 2